MPQYNYRCRSCDYRFTDVKSIEDRKVPTEQPCPNCCNTGDIYLSIDSAPAIGYSIAPGLRTTDDFNSRLKEIKKRSGKGNTVGDAIR